MPSRDRARGYFHACVRSRKLPTGYGDLIDVRKEAIDMTRILVAVGIALLSTSYSWAQSEANCEQIRQAVAQYGYAAARAHAMAHYGADAVRNGDRCLGRGGVRGGRAAGRYVRSHHARHHHR